MTNQEKLVQNAIMLFRREGMSGLSMGALAKKAGLAKASLFHHFPSKDDLFSYMIDFLITQIESLAFSLEEETEAARAFQSYADFHCSDCEDHAPLLDAFACHAAVMNETNHKKILAAMETDSHMLAAILHDGKQAGIWRFNLSLTAIAPLVQSLVLSAGRRGWIYDDRTACNTMLEDIKTYLQQA